jgi:GUN4-like/ARM-like repeat domain, GUN4-N terminal
MPDVQQSDIGASNFSATQESSVSEYMTALLNRLKSESVKNQLQLLQELAAPNEAGLEVLMSFLRDRSATPSLIDGKAYQILLSSGDPKAQEFLKTQFPQGLVPLQSQQGVDYSSLQDLLVRQEFQAADRLTLEKMCELAGASAVQRKWLYFTEAEKLPTLDLRTINTLWQVYSEGKFGFSVQRELWVSTGNHWEALWGLIGWKSGNNWTRYPQEFTWNLSAPKGHLPLSNQLRGVRVISALLTHPAWD